ncbi:MAG TPA: helix-turn-helix transcriptional regulator [Firmicutes bacterium]|nr:helix-turn-helix transcriptional regulator [Bacillota bacterium]
MTQMNSVAQISELARMLYISQSHLFALFHNDLLCSPYQLWTKIKIEQACSKILQERIPVNDLAGMYGFATRRSFESAFRRCTGTTVSQYRECGLFSS